MSTGHQQQGAGAGAEAEAPPPVPRDLPAFLPYACKVLGSPFDVRVDVHTQEEYVSITDTPKRGKVKPVSRQTSAPDTEKVEESGTQALFYAEEGDEVVVTVLMDASGHLVEIHFHSVHEVPCLLIKVIGLCLPFHQLLNKLEVRWSRLSGIALYELSKFLTGSHITELCLDDSPVSDRNYAVLLQHPSHLRRLSLARCQLDDEDCAALCAKLVYPLPAAATLRLLDLASNAISDAGARALAEMLRTNRTLQYLNLSGNRITDDGARHIFEILVEFTLTAREIRDKRLRTMEYSKMRNEMYEECLREAMRENNFARSRIIKRSVTRSAKRSPLEACFSLDAVSMRAETLLAERLAAHADPYVSDETAVRAGALRCRGNRTLCYLNLCYNKLGHSSLGGLVEVLVEQSSWTSRFGAGLMRALVEGNPLPELCEELTRLDELLENIYKAREALAKEAHGRAARRAERANRSSKSQLLRTK